MLDVYIVISEPPRENFVVHEREPHSFALQEFEKGYLRLRTRIALHHAVHQRAPLLRDAYEDIGIIPAQQGLHFLQPPLPDRGEDLRDWIIDEGGCLRTSS